MSKPVQPRLEASQNTSVGASHIGRSEPVKPRSSMAKNGWSAVVGHGWRDDLQTPRSPPSKQPTPRKAPPDPKGIETSAKASAWSSNTGTRKAPPDTEGVGIQYIPTQSSTWRLEVLP